MTKTILAIDVGTKRIGVAGTDALGITVQPIEVVERCHPNDVNRLCELMQERQVGTMVVGLPLRGDDGEVGFQAQKVRKFSAELQVAMQGKGITAQVVEWDESMTTHEAEEKLREAGVRRVRRGKMIDAMAAVAILESYLRGTA